MNKVAAVFPLKTTESMFRYQREMAAYIHNAESRPPSDWVGSARIEPAKAGEIYRRNLYAGALANLSSCFAVTKSYIGDSGFAWLCKEFVRNRPPTTPVFRTLAVHFPEFVSSSNLPLELRQCLSGLATLDFILLGSLSTPVSIDKRYMLLYASLGELTARSDNSGLYRLPRLHPEVILAAAAVEGVVNCRCQGRSVELLFSESEPSI